MSWRLLLGFVAAWAVLDRVAALTASDYGNSGLLVGAVAVSTLIGVEMWLCRKGPAAAWRDLGFGRPTVRGVAAAAIVCVLMLAFYPVFSVATDTPLEMRPGWGLLVPGLFAQGGIAEEALFRGYLYGHLRRTRGFWRAAWLSVPPFVTVHLLLFTYMHPAVAAAASVLALTLSFPLARLYDLSGGTIWAPALLHFVAQASVKLIVTPEPRQMPMSIAWMGVCMLAPWLVFVMRQREDVE